MTPAPSGAYSQKDPLEPVTSTREKIGTDPLERIELYQTHNLYRFSTLEDRMDSIDGKLDGLAFMIRSFGAREVVKQSEPGSVKFAEPYPNISRGQLSDVSDQEPLKGFSDSSSDSSDSSKKASPVTLRRSKRRDSYLDKAAKTQSTGGNSIVMYQQQPSFDHIFLSKLNVPSAVKFVSDILNYQTRYAIKLNISTQISDNIRDNLIAQDSDYSMDEAKFYTLSSRQILGMIQRIVRPNDRATFQSYLSKYVSFKLMPGYKPTPLDFKPMYQALLLYRKEFCILLDFM
jgi:hypothetical protein